MKLIPLLGGIGAIACLAACASTPVDPSLPTGMAAYGVIPAPGTAVPPREYHIGPLDTLRVNVFQERDLSFDTLPVDSSGNISFPLLGIVSAQDKTVTELSAELARRLGAKYLVNPQVTVSVVTAVSQRVTVEGDVNEPGVYDISGSTTLLEALARAKSPNDVAKLDQIVVFRQVGERRMGAVFNLNDIRAGTSPDPRILGGDVIVVGFSGNKVLMRDFLRAAPLLNVFRYF